MPTHIGVPKEIKNHEYRVALTPGGVRELTHHGHRVSVQSGAGAGIGCSDADYQAAGAAILPDAAAVFAAADLIVKVKEPQPQECAMLRKGQTLAVSLPVSTDRPKLIPFLHGDYPAYFIFGPLVFSVATEDFIGVFTSSANPAALAGLNALTALGNPLVTRRSDRPAFAGEELVFVSSPFLPHKVSKGYGTPVLKVVEAINGTKVKNLAHLVTLLRDSKDEFIVIDFATPTAETMVFPRAETAAATEGILSDNGIRAQASPELLTLWNAKPGK